MRKCVNLTPLTAEERMFSEENYPVLEWCIRISRLDEDDYDLAYLAYLHAVKKWHVRPELRKWSFKMIARQTLRSYISNEQRKAARRIQAVSLEEHVPGTEGLILMDSITEENIRFLKGTEDFWVDRKETKRKISYDVEIPAAVRKGHTHVGVDTELLLNFLEDASHKTMCIEYSDIKMAANKAGNFRKWKKNNRREDFNVRQFGERVYIEKCIKRKGAK